MYSQRPSIDSPWYNSSQAELYLTYDRPYVQICKRLMKTIAYLLFIRQIP